MKTHMLFPRSPLAAKFLTGILALTFSSGTIMAQFAAPASIADIQLTHTVNGATVSTAMIEHVDSEQPISVIAYSSVNRMGFYVQYEDAIDKFDDFEPARWSAVDVAIADDINTLGQYYYVAVVYKAFNTPMTHYDLKLKLFHIEVSPGSISIIGGAPVDSVSFSTVPVTETGNLRIDAVASLTQDHGPGIPVIDKFAVLYPMNANTYIREIASDLTWSQDHLVAAIPFVGKDIAVAVDRDNGTGIHAHVGSLVGNMLFKLGYNLTLNIPTPPSGPYTANVYPVSGPRIEAFGLSDPSGNTADWAMVADVGNMHDSIMLYTNLTPWGQKANPTMGNRQEFPTIAAGIGPMVSSRADFNGNYQYSFAWGNVLIPSFYGGNYFANYLDSQGILLSPMDCQYVNSTTGPLVMSSDPGDQISMSNSCNSGMGTVVAWLDGQDVMYKILKDGSYQFGPQKKEQTGTISLTPAVYPNPASDHFIVKYAQQGTPLQVFNNLGQVVLREMIQSDQTRVDVSSLTPGSYNIEFTDRTGKPSRQKLVLTP